MRFSVRKQSENCIIELPKNIFEPKNLSCLKQKMEELKEDGSKTFLLNMGQITKVDDAALAMILGLYKFSFYHEVSIKLYNLHPSVSQLIFQTRLNIIFDICDSNDENLKSFEKYPNKKQTA